MKYANIKITEITQRENSRSIYNNSDLSELMASLKKDGLLHLIGLRTIDKDKYEVVYGNRRFMAAKKLGWEEVGAVVYSKDEIVTNEERDILNLVENLKRTNISSHDEGKVFNSLLQRNLTIEEIAARMGVSRNRVAASLDVFRTVPVEYRDKIVPTITGSRLKAGKMAASTVSYASGIKRKLKLNKEQSGKLFDVVMKNNATKPQVKLLARLLAGGAEIDTAWSTIEQITPTTLSFNCTSEAVRHIERKYKTNYNTVLMNYLLANKEFGIIPAGKRGVTIGFNKRPVGRPRKQRIAYP